jgi:hypothetical protein
MADACLKAYGDKEPDSVIDVGSSLGALLQHFPDYMHKMGIDKGCEHLYLDESGTYYEQDLNEGSANVGEFSIVVCQEVIEHIEPENEANVLDTICSNHIEGGIIVFGGALPGQRGNHHVNCQTLEYWVDRFKSRGYKLDKEKTEIYKDNLSPDVPKHYSENTMVFVDED